MAGLVNVGCKMPNGIHLEFVTTFRDSKGNVLRANRERFATLRGAAVKHGEPDHTVMGAAFTQVDADKWAYWLKENDGNSLIADGMVFAEVKVADAHAHAKDEAARAGQFTPLAERGDPRWIKGVKAASMEDAA